MKKTAILLLASILPLAACTSTNDGCGADCTSECCAPAATEVPAEAPAASAESMAMASFELGRVP